MEDSKFSKVIEIVKAMNAEGLAISDIKDSLKQIGIKDDEIDLIIQKASAEPTVKDLHEAVKNVEARVTEPLKVAEERRQMTQDVKDRMEDLSLGLEEHSQNLEQITANLEEHRDKLDAIHDSIQDLGERHESLHEKIKDVTSLTDEMAELREIMLDMKAMMGALRDLDTKILEINKQMLMRLK